MDKTVLPRLTHLSARFVARMLLLVAAVFLCGGKLTAGAAPADRKLFPGSLKPMAEARRAAAVTAATVDASAGVDFQIVLRMRNFAKLQARLGSGERISEKEMQAKYYPLASDYEALAAWAKGQGLTVLGEDADHLNLRLRGTVATAERVLATRYAHVAVGSKDFLAAQAVPSLPAKVAAPVLGITGLQPYQQAKRFSPTYAYVPPYTIKDINTAYNALNLPLDGTGQTIAILIDTAPDPSDVAQFWRDNNVKQRVGNVTVINVNDVPLPEPGGEETLDVSWAGGIAPASKIRVYAAGSLYFTDLDKALQRLLDDVRGGANIAQLSISLGLDENEISPDTVLTESQYFASLASRGVSTFVSTGDSSETAYMSTDPAVTAVGGTSLLINRNTQTIASEKAWSTTGGGTSMFFDRPPYQAPANATVPSTKRTVPDVALAADPDTGAYLIFKGTVYVVGGTSWSAPTWAGYCALLNQARANAGLPSIGLLNPSIYPLLGTTNFRDILTGDNGRYQAGAGYDEVTGIGVPVVSNLITTLTSGGSLAVNSFTPDSGVPGTQVTLNGTQLDLTTAVAFNGTTTVQFQAVSGTRLLVTVPDGATTGPITVVSRGGQTASTATNFTVLPSNAGRNDLFANAELIGPSQSTLTGTNVGATKEAGEPNHAGNAGGASVWYRWTPPADGTYTFNTFGSSFDTLLAVYVGDRVDDLEEVASNDDLSTNVTSSVAFDATLGVTYYIAVDGASQNGGPAAQGTVKLNLASANDAPVITNFTPAKGSPGQSVRVLGANFLAVTNVAFNGASASFRIDSGTQITAVVPAGATTGPISVTDSQNDTTESDSYFTVVPVPANDLFANARTFSGTQTTTGGTNVGAFKEPGEPNHAGNPGGSSVWFSWTAPASGLYVFDTFNSDFDTLLAIYTGNSVAALTGVASNDDAGPLGTSSTTFNAVAGTVYRIAVDGYNGAAGNYQLNVQANSGKPVVTGLTPSSGGAGVGVVISGSGFLTATSVKFNGTTAPNFQVNSDSQITVSVPDGATTGPVSVTAQNGTGVSPIAFTVVALPANDNFGDAQILTGGVPIAVTGSSAGATKQAGEPNLVANDAGGRSIWYSWTPPVSGDYVVSTQGSDFDTLLGVFTGTTVTNLQLVASNDDDAEGGVTSALTFTATRGVTYHVAVDGARGEAGNVSLSINGAATSLNLYTTNFESAEGFSNKQPLVGQQGWISFYGDTGGNGVATNAIANLGQQGLVGQTPVNGGVADQHVYHPFFFSQDDTYPIVSFSTVLKIVGSTNGRNDQFGFSAGTETDTGGDPTYFSLVFDNATSAVYYRLGDTGALQPTGASFSRDVIYSLAMDINFRTSTVTATLNGTPVFTNLRFASLGTLSRITADWVAASASSPGDNYMVFDQYAVTAPSSSAPVITSQPGDQTTLIDQPVTFAVAATGTPTLTYQWYFNGRPILDGTGNKSTYTIAKAQPSNAGRYAVEVGNGYGSVRSLDAFLVVSTNQVQPTAAVSVQAKTAKITSTGSKDFFILKRTGDTSKALAVEYKLGGGARQGTDYQRVTGRKTFKAGKSQLKVPIIPVDQGIHDGSEVKLTIKILSGNGYTIDGKGSAKILIERP